MGCGGVQVGQVVETLRGCSHQAFPVTPDVDKAFESAEPFDLHGKPTTHLSTQTACLPGLLLPYVVCHVSCTPVSRQCLAIKNGALCYSE